MSDEGEKGGRIDAALVGWVALERSPRLLGSYLNKHSNAEQGGSHNLRSRDLGIVSD